MTPASPKISSRDRVMAAAGSLFAQHGLEGATTRAIARQAGVNEVTLFRLFESKDKLKAAVLRHVFQRQAQLLALDRRRPSQGLRSDLLHFAQTYSAAITENLSLIRRIIGEIQHPREEEAQLLKAIFTPLRAEFLGILKKARAAGHLRPGLDLIAVGTLFPQLILMDMLRRDGPPSICPPYSQKKHIAAAVDVYLHGIVANRAALRR